LGRPCSAFGDPEHFDGPLIVSAVNSDYLSLLVNWACTRLAFNLGNATEDTVLLTADLESYDMAVSLGAALRRIRSTVGTMTHPVDIQILFDVKGWFTRHLLC
jgi:hypothetical protein